MKKDFLHISDFTKDEIISILDRARFIKKKFYSNQQYEPFKGKSLAMIFSKPSARTRVSFEVAMNQLGGRASFLSLEDLQISRGEFTS